MPPLESYGSLQSTEHHLLWFLKLLLCEPFTQQASLETSCMATPGLERQEEARAALRSTTSWESMEVTGSRPHRIAQGKCRTPWKHRSQMPNSAWGRKGRSQHPPERRCSSQTLRDQWESARQMERTGFLKTGRREVQCVLGRASWRLVRIRSTRCEQTRQSVAGNPEAWRICHTFTST